MTEQPIQPDEIVPGDPEQGGADEPGMPPENGTGDGEQPGDTGDTESTPYLVRPTMLPIQGVIYCLDHTAVHDDTTDPYRMGSEECRESEHRSVYYRGRKGDVDERVDMDEPDDSDLGHEKVRLPDTRVIAPSQGERLDGAERDLVIRMVNELFESSDDVLSKMRRLLGDDSKAVIEVEDMRNTAGSVLLKLDDGSGGT